MQLSWFGPDSTACLASCSQLAAHGWRMISSLADSERVRRLLRHHIDRLTVRRLVRYSGVGEEFLSQNLSFSLLTQTGRPPATPVQVANVCWREQNAAPIE
jgi:hypothetical protein